VLHEVQLTRPAGASNGSSETRVSAPTGT
jgi:hypothetical protein